MGGPAWAGWDERISLFDPIGSLLDPLEEAVPGLMIKGMLRDWTRMASHRRTYDPDPRIDFRRSKTFPSIEWLGELEFRFQVSPNLEVVNIENFLYDTAYLAKR